MGKRLLLVVGSFKTGGAERIALITGGELEKKGYEVHYVLQRNIFELPHDVPMDRIHVLRKKNSQNKLYKIYSLFVGIFIVCLKIKPNYIIAFSRVSSFISCFTFHRKILARFDANPYILSKKQHRYANFVLNWPFIKKIIVPSTGMYEAISKVNPKYKDKLIVVPNSLDFNKVQELSNQSVDFDPEYKFICAMGRLSEDKNFELLLNAYGQSRIREKFKLVIIGDGRLWQKLNSLAEELGIGNDVVFMGFVKNPYPILAKSEFLVNTSIKESFCNVILEGLALSLPVIATNCTYGPSDMVKNNVNGFLIESNNQDELVDTLDKIAVDTNVIYQFKGRTKESVRPFLLSSVIQKWTSLLELE